MVLLSMETMKYVVVLCVITFGKFIGFDMNETCEISLFMFGYSEGKVLVSWDFGFWM